MIGVGKEDSGIPSRGSVNSSSSRTYNEASRENKSNAATGASAAGSRALATQMMAFYFRAPAKAFFRARVE